MGIYQVDPSEEEFEIEEDDFDFIVERGERDELDYANVNNLDNSTMYD